MSTETTQLGDETDILLQRGVDALKALSKLVLEGRKPPAGSYAFFSHNAHALTSLQDCGRIIARMRLGRSHLTALAWSIESLRREIPQSEDAIPKNIQQLMGEENNTNELMKLDFESLYIFGGIVLDQWSLLAVTVGNIPIKKVHPFRELTDFLDSMDGHALVTVWAKIRPDMLWLYYQLRFYRNKFIVHANRPWQRGTTRSVYGSDFNLFTPTPPGWIDDEALDEEIRTLLPLTPERIRNGKDDYWEKSRAGRIIEVLFDIIPDFDKKSREKISHLFSKKGGSTPNFLTVANRLLQFIAIATEELIAIASLHMETIDLGKPHSTSEELFSRRKDVGQI